MLFDLGIGVSCLVFKYINIEPCFLSACELNWNLYWYSAKRI